MTVFLYRCPTTGHKVQGFVADNSIDANGHVYEALKCPACAGIHLVNPQTGKVLGDSEKK